MHLESMEKTTVTTPFGAFKYRRMNFGLWNATQCFQRFITKVISGKETFASPMLMTYLLPVPMLKNTSHIFECCFSV